jgi:hypothetical protein
VTGASPAARRSIFDRLVSVYPLVLAYVVLLILYAWQASKHSTPWVFTDELEWARLSQAVAHHGAPQLRLQPVAFSSLYEYLIAPAWWLGATGRAYAAAKDINVTVMTASLFPTYALARLFVPRTAAIACGVAAAAVPALVYSGMLIPEPLAYFWSAVVLWLLARALLVRTRLAAALAAGAIILAPAVRSQLAVLALAALVAAVLMAATSPGGRRLIAGWSSRERLGAIVLAIGGLIALGALANHHSYSWEIGTHFHHRMFTYGLWAFGAFVIGIGVLPAVTTLTWLLGTRWRLPEERALAATLVGATIAFGLYTAVKASYISTQFAIRVEERNLIYLAPIVFVVTARWALLGRARLVPLAVSTAAVWYLLDTTPYHNTEHFYSDAPGLSILQWLNRKPFYFTTTDARRLVFGILIGTVALMLLRELARHRGGLRRLGPATAALLAVAVVAWNLTGEIAAGNASNSFSASQRSVLPTPPDWIDRATGRARTMYIGESLGGSNAFWSTEFWNQSIQDVWSVDATAPGPGLERTPNYLDLTGAVDPQLPLDWIVAAPGVDPVGSLRETVGGQRLFHVSHPIRIADAEGGISTDAAWMSASSWYYRFTSAGTKPGYATVSLSRAAACGGYPPSHLTIKLSSLRIDSDGQPVAKRVLAVRRLTLHSNPCETRVVRIPAVPPFRIDITARGTFQPSQYDLRELSAQVAFGFTPGRS